MDHEHKKGSFCNAIWFFVLLLLLGVLSADWIAENYHLGHQQVVEFLDRSININPVMKRMQKPHLLDSTSQDHVQLLSVNNYREYHKGKHWTLSVILVKDRWNVIATERHNQTDSMVWIASKPCGLSNQNFIECLKNIVDDPRINPWIISVSTSVHIGSLMVSFDPEQIQKGISHNQLWKSVSAVMSPLIPSPVHVTSHLSSDAWVLMQSLHEFPNANHHVLLKSDEIIWINRAIDDQHTAIISHLPVEPSLWIDDIIDHVPDTSKLNKPVHNFDLIQWVNYFSEMMHEDDDDVLNSDKILEDSIISDEETVIVSVDKASMANSMILSMMHQGLSDQEILINFAIRCGTSGLKKSNHDHRVLELILPQSEVNHEKEAQKIQQPILKKNPPKPVVENSMESIFAMANQNSVKSTLFAPRYQKSEQKKSKIRESNKPWISDDQTNKEKHHHHYQNEHKLTDIQQAIKSKIDTPSFQQCLLASKYIAIVKWLKYSAFNMQKNYQYQLPNVVENAINDRESCHLQPESIWSSFIPTPISNLGGRTTILKSKSASWYYAQKMWVINTQLPIKTTKNLCQKCPL